MGTVETGVSSPFAETAKVQGSEKEKNELREALGSLRIEEGSCGGVPENGVPENGVGLSSCAEQGLGGEGVVEVVKSSVVETKVSVLRDSGCEAYADSEVNGFSALLKMQESAVLSGGGAEKLGSAFGSERRVAGAAVLVGDGLARVGGVPENGVGLSSRGEEGLGDERVVEVVKSNVLETKVSVLKDNDCQVYADSSEVNGFTSLLKMQESAVLSDGGAEKLDSACASGGVAGAAVLLTGDGSVRVDREDVRDGKTSEEEEKDEECDGKIVTIEVPIVEQSENTMDVAEDSSDEGYGFSVGDFVWGKIKSHPWWPGRVYDPFDASDAALKLKQKNRLLVAYFGDGTFAWCHPSQLKPFEENFIDMVRQSGSKAFVNAVQEAVNEVGRLLYVKLSHSVVAEKTKSELAPPLVKNFGIKKGVLVPESGIERLSGFPIEPAHLLSQVKQIAEIIDVASILELEMLKARISVFYLSRGGYKLPAYEDPLPVPGLEDATDDAGDSKSAVEAPVHGPFEDIYSTSPLSLKFGDPCHSSGLSGNTLNHRRKQKSIAEIIGEEKDVDPKNMEEGATDDVVDAIGSGGRKKRKGSGDTMASKPVQKKKKLLLNMLSDENGDSGGKESIKKGQLLKSKDKNEETEKETDKGKSKEPNEKGYLSRERKKSKYLSPPFTASTWELKQGYRETAFPEVSSDTSSYQTQDDENKTFDLKKIKSSSEDVLSGIWYAAISPQIPRERTSDDEFFDFISVFRSSLYHDGSLYEVYNEHQPGSKRKKPESELEVLGKDQTQSDHESPYQDSAPTKRRKETAPSMPRGKRAPKTGKNEGADKASGAVIYVSFWPGSTLPSRSDLVSAYSKYGPLNEEETDMFVINQTARVTFLRSFDAEKALIDSQNKNPFKSCEVTFELEYLSAGSKSGDHVVRSKSRLLRAKEKGNAPAPAPATPSVSVSQVSEADKLNLNIIKQKLQGLALMLESSDGTSPDFKTKVETEVKGLLEDVNKMV